MSKKLEVIALGYPIDDGNIFIVWTSVLIDLLDYGFLFYFSKLCNN
jgi:hypothetical protein